MALFAAFWQLNCETPARVRGFMMGLCPVSFIFNYFSSLRVTVQSFAVSSLTWESSPLHTWKSDVIYGPLSWNLPTWPSEKGRCLQWAQRLKKRQPIIFAPAENKGRRVCFGERLRRRWSAALWREDANFVSVVITQRGLGSASWMEELNSGFAPLLSLRLHSSAAAFVSLLFLFSWPNIQIWGGGWLKVYQPAPVRSSAREKNVFMMLYL